MSVRRIEYAKERKNTVPDARRGVWVGWLADLTENGRRRRYGPFATKQKAEAFLTELNVQRRYRRAGLKGTASVPRASEVFEARKGRIRNEKELQRAERIFRCLLDVIAFDPPVTELRTAHLQQFINSRLGDGLKASSVHREMTILSAALRAAPEMFPDALDDWQPPRIPRPKVKKDKGRTRVITEREKDAIVAAIRGSRLAREHLRRRMSRANIALGFELAWMLGLRIGEVLRLAPSDFDDAGRSLRVVRWKTGVVSRFDHLPDRIMEILREAERDEKRLFAMHCSQHTLYDVLKQACETAGIEYGRDKLDGVTFHATRHSFTTRLVQVADIATAQSLTSHSNAEMLAYYSHASDESRRAAMEALYGTDDEARLREIFELVRKKEMKFGEFKKAVRARK